MHQRVREGQIPWSTKQSHMPESHREFLAWNGKRFRAEAAEVGPSCSEVMASMLTLHRVEQQAYRSCKGLISLAKTLGRAMLEQACAKALSYTKNPSYKNVKSVMARAYREQEEASGVEEMAFDERFAMLVDAEWDSRRSNKRVRLLRAAGLAEPGANVMDVRYDADASWTRGRLGSLPIAAGYAIGETWSSSAQAEPARHGWGARWAWPHATTSTRFAT